MKRLYWNHILARTNLRYNGIWRCQLLSDNKMHLYEVGTLEELYKAIKADGWQVWGYKDYLDYFFPHNALDYLMLRDILRARGMAEEEIEKTIFYFDDTP